MTKWFDTNYHYIVPELTADMELCLSSNKALDEYKEAKFLGIATRPVPYARPFASPPCSAIASLQRRV